MIGDIAYNNKNVTIKSILKDYSDKFDTLQLCFISDTHIGSSDFDCKGLMDNLEYAEKQENAIIFFLGDGINSAIIGSKSDTYSDVLNPHEQLDEFSQILKLAKNDKLVKVLKNLEDTGKIIVVHSGNHEDRITKAVGLSPTKIATDIAGVGDSFAPFFASTNLVLRQPESEDGKFHYNIVSHHGTGIKNIDGTFRLLRNINNADMCVIGHTHQYTIKTDRIIRVNKDTEDQEYHDVICMCLPSSGGGTYGAGMCLNDVYKQSAVWLALSSQANPYADKISPNGIKQPKFLPTCAYFSPTNTINSKEEARVICRTNKIIEQNVSKNSEIIERKIDELIETIKQQENETVIEVLNRIKKNKIRVPKGFDDYILGDK